MKLQPMAEESKRIRENGRHRPLRSFRELCEELGVDHTRLVRLLGKHPGPKPKINHSARAAVHANSWYDPLEVRAWWGSLTLEQKRG